MAEKIGEKLKTAKRFKDEGNELYRTGDFKAAAKKYHRAILFLKGIDSDVHGGTPIPILKGLGHDTIELTEELQKDCIETNIAVYNNLAASLLQIPGSEASAVEKYADIVIELDETNEKAWYRKGQALMHLKKFEEAKQSFEKSSSLSLKSGKENKNVAKMLRECDIQIEKIRKEEKAIYQKMFKKSVV